MRFSGRTAKSKSGFLSYGRKIGKDNYSQMGSSGIKCHQNHNLQAPQFASAIS
jgi:hypothetical protein